uniref:EGF-like domain-containing protein n=1 Tax=Branchiostoma floridae TaxID=7739 RepID=C3YFW5_BRAFL|eukprot:XP_002604760.1 hypothetical protein BRAFLDRAFT_222406 [Branchiostoma floridae]
MCYSLNFLDIDECLDNSDVCHEDAHCYNTVGSYNCACGDGYGGDGFNCTDINECSDPGLHSCTQNATCMNTEGGYKCVCNEGFTLQGSICIDIDECKEARLHNCSQNQTCANTQGSYVCVCKEGFHDVSSDEEEPVCIDVDECEEGTSHCHPNATCQNVVGVGQYNCTCDSGFAGDGFRCKDIDECKEASLHNCSQNQTCANTQGSYVCVCKEGFHNVAFDEEEPVCIGE